MIESGQRRRKNAGKSEAEPAYAGRVARCATAWQALRRRKRVLRGIDLDLAFGRLPRRHPGPTAPARTTLLRICAGPGAADRGHDRAGASRRGAIGYLGHEPLVYRELTALEKPRALRPVSTGVARATGSGSGCCSSGSGSGRPGTTAVASYSRGMTQRLALCRVLLPRPGAARPRRAVQRPSTRLAAELLDAPASPSSAARRGRSCSQTHEPRASRPVS